MTDPSLQIREERTFSTVRFIMPMRRISKASAIGWFLMGFAVLEMCFMAFWVSGPLRGFFNDESVMRWFLLFFLFASIPGFAVGVFMFSLGRAVQQGRSYCELVLDRDELIVIERIGLLRWKRRRRLSDIDRVVVRDAVAPNGSRPQQVPWLDPDMGALMLEGSSRTPTVAALFYPRPLLRELAGRITAEMGKEGEGFVTEERQIAVVDTSSDALEPGHMPQPAGSTITVQDIPGGFSVLVPPAGLVKGSKGLFIFSIFWNAFICLFVYLAARDAIKGEREAIVVLAAVIFIFGGVGLGMLLVSINMGRRKTMIAYVNNTLACQRISPFGTKVQQMNFDEIMTICVGPTGMEVNDRPVNELQIISRNGVKIGLLSERNDEELQWLAWLLRKKVEEFKS